MDFTKQMLRVLPSGVNYSIRLRRLSRICPLPLTTLALIDRCLISAPTFINSHHWLIHVIARCACLRRIYPDLPRASLDVVFEHLFPGEGLNHHHAEADAIAAGRVFVEMQRGASISELDALLSPARQSRAGKSPLESDALNVSQLVERFGTSTALHGENICFTRALTRGTRADMEEFLGHVGAVPAKNVTKKTTLLVVGVPNPSAWREGSSASRKLEKASALREKDAPIRVLSEEDFFALLEQ